MISWQQTRPDPTTVGLHDRRAVPCRAELRIRRPDGDWAAVLSCGVVIASAPDGTPRRMAVNTGQEPHFFDGEVSVLIFSLV